MPGNQYTPGNVLTGAATLWVGPALTPLVGNALPIDTSWASVTITATGPVAGGALPTAPLLFPIPSGTLLSFGAGKSATTTALAPIGAVTVPASATAGTIVSGDTATYSTGWTAAGATMKGVDLKRTTQTQSTNIDEQVTEVGRYFTSGTFGFSTVLAEDTVETMKLAYGSGAITITAPTSTTPGVKDLALSDSLDQLAFALEGKNAQGFWRRIYVPVGVSTGSPTTTYQRAATNRQYAVDLNAICKTSDIVIRDMTLPHS
jgi:hypothetical protein